MTTKKTPDVWTPETLTKAAVPAFVDPLRGQQWTQESGGTDLVLLDYAASTEGVPDGGVAVWHRPTGHDLGTFASLEEATAAVRQALTPPDGWFTDDDAIYGLRNLWVGDEEETRIDTYENLPTEVQHYLDVNEFVGAYETAIRLHFGQRKVKDIRPMVVAWVREWNHEYPYARVSVRELLRLLADIRRRGTR